MLCRALLLKRKGYTIENVPLSGNINITLFISLLEMTRKLINGVTIN